MERNMTASDEPRGGEKSVSEEPLPHLVDGSRESSVDAGAQQGVARPTHRAGGGEKGNPRPATRDQIGDGMETDQLTIQRAIEGDERALRLLWSRYAPRIEAVVLRLAGDADLAADIAQEVWMQIFRALPTFRGDSQFGTWAHRIAVNRTLNALRKARRTSRMEVEITEDAALVEAEEDRPFVASTIERAAARLPEGARTVFVLHDVEGYTHEDIARELGITAGASKSQLFKARAKLRRLLAPLLDVPEPAADGVHATPGS
jgi:RNA polymerase sigma-70 factor (ECF subfamily)